MTDRDILRELAREYAAFAAEAHQETARKNWGRLLALDNTAKPAIMIDQIPWHEMNVNDELTCRCTDPELRKIEESLRITLYRYRHFKADMVLPPFLTYSKAFSDTGCGITGAAHTEEIGHEGAETHLFEDQLPDEASLAKLHRREIVALPEETERRRALREELFGDILPVRAAGQMLWAALWDRIVFWRGAEKVLYAFYDEPEYLHKLMQRMVDIEMNAIDQLEAQNLLQAGPGSVCHCMETYVDEPKWYAIDQNHIRASDCWISGAAQIFSEVSPDMHDEFEIEYLKPIYDRFGWVNYGCCEPLDRKIDIIRKMPTVRTISASPWTNVERQSEAMGRDFVMVRKPNPAFVASGHVDADSVRKETRATLSACAKNGTPVVFILKDITTVGNRPQCLTEWCELVQSEIENF